MTRTYGHYRSKSDCMKMIEKTIQKKPIKRELIYYFAMSEFGFGQNLVDKMLETLIKAELVKEEEGVIKSVL